MSVPLSDLMLVLCQHRLTRRAGSTLGIGQHAVCAGESISVQKWNSPHDGQVHYTDVAAGTSTA